MQFHTVGYLLLFWVIPCEVYAYFNSIIVPAFGSFAELGEIYDTKTDTFTRINLFQSGIIDPFIRTYDTPQTTSQFDSSSTTSEKLDLFDFDGEIKLKILAKILNVGGVQGKYIKNSMNSNSSVEFSYLLQTKTKKETFKWDENELRQYYNLSKIKNHGTHVVIGIQYGGNAFVTISQKLTRSSISRRAEVQNNLGITIINFLNIGTFSDTKVPYNKTMKNTDFDIKVEADVSPEEGDDLITLEGAFKYVNSLSGRLKKYNNGNGIILHYEMVPLHYIDSISKPYIPLSNDIIFSVNQKLLHLEAINKKIVEFFHELEENIIYFTDEQHMEWNSQKLRYESNISSLFEKINSLISLYHTNKSQADEYLKHITTAMTTLKREVHIYNNNCENLLIKMDFIKNAEANNFQYIFQWRQFEGFKVNHRTSIFYFFTNRNYENYRNFFLNYLKDVIQGKSPQFILTIVNADKLGNTRKNMTFKEADEYPLYLYEDQNFQRIIHTKEGYTVLPSVTKASIGLARTNAKCLSYDCPIKFHSLIPENTTIPTNKFFSHWFNVYSIKPKTKIEIYLGNYEQTFLDINIEVDVRGKKERFELSMEININATLLINIKNSQLLSLLQETMDYPYPANKKTITFKPNNVLI